MLAGARTPSSACLYACFDKTTALSNSRRTGPDCRAHCV